MESYPREELEDMMRRWLEANAQAERVGDWGAYLGPFYADDAVYRSNFGPNTDFVARGRKEITATALGSEMLGFEGWRYPYQSVLIYDKQGEVVAFWRQIAPYRRSDGTPYEVAGTSGSRFTYAGGGKWASQLDFLDIANVLALLTELAANGHLSPRLAQRLASSARGKHPGHEKLRSDAPSKLRMVKGCLALARATLIGR